jgi:hypothetical protein
MTRQLGLLTPLAGSPEDLQANRAGEVTPAQRAMLAGYARDSKGWGALSVAGVLALFGGGLGYGFLIETRSDERRGMLIGLLMALGAALVAWIASARLWKRLPGARLRMARGVAVKRIGSGEYSETHTLDVGRVRFYVARPVFDAFEEGQPYRVYFVPHFPMPIMLSFERDLHPEEA